MQRDYWSAVVVATRNVSLTSSSSQSLCRTTTEENRNLFTVFVQLNILAAVTSSTHCQVLNNNNNIKSTSPISSLEPQLYHLQELIFSYFNSRYVIGLQSKSFVFYPGKFMCNFKTGKTQHRRCCFWYIFKAKLPVCAVCVGFNRLLAYPSKMYGQKAS